ncbi:MAG: 50S ribosomal protein L10 [Chlamydiae bacterium GWC2_50_10]|nr:MAG: 50S ribosomal protein L10 [Chlamydiae bacterium GWC2_50_10]HCJ84650.1 50S ribosomal protein L10 [Parachlamydiales bacterium]
MRKEKQLLLDEIKEMMDRSTSLVITRYQNMNPNLFYHFRSRLRESGGEMEVIRKRLLMKVAQTVQVPLSASMLGGHIGVVFAYRDPMETIKALIQFSKENEETFEIVAGRFEGAPCSAKDISLIAALPSQNEMRAQFLATLEAPMSQTLSSIEALLASLMYCMDNRSALEEKKK